MYNKYQNSFTGGLNLSAISHKAIAYGHILRPERLKRLPDTLFDAVGLSREDCQSEGRLEPKVYYRLKNALSREIRRALRDLRTNHMVLCKWQYQFNRASYLLPLYFDHQEPCAYIAIAEGYGKTLLTASDVAHSDTTKLYLAA